MDAQGREIDAATLRLVLNRTGCSERTVAREVLRNPSFRALCYDLRVCDRALKYWTESDSGSSRQRMAEYAQLLDELTEEIRVAIFAGARSRTASVATARRR